MAVRNQPSTSQDFKDIKTSAALSATWDQHLSRRYIISEELAGIDTHLLFEAADSSATFLKCIDFGTNRFRSNRYVQHHPIPLSSNQQNYDCRRPIRHRHWSLGFD